MARSATPADLIVERIGHHLGCGLDDLVMLCPELTYNQIFLEVDRLSRDGVLKLALIGPGRYVVEVPPNVGSRMRRSREGLVHMSALERLPQDAQCARCGGLMVSEEYDDFNGWRCILCGERVDPVILAQRRKSEWPCPPNSARGSLSALGDAKRSAYTRTVLWEFLRHVLDPATFGPGERSSVPLMRPKRRWPYDTAVEIEGVRHRTSSPAADRSETGREKHTVSGKQCVCSEVRGVA